jgi:hypothetical protein
VSLPLPHLVPAPRRLRTRAGTFDAMACTAICTSTKIAENAGGTARIIDAAFARSGDGVLEITRGERAAPGEVWLDIAPLASPQHYRIELGPRGAAIVGGGEAGLFYAAQTFAQLLAQARDGKLPALRIDDGPDFRVRGFYHDISRGKVPTRATLFTLIEKLARYKINQLQLYIEHTFAFANHPDVWAGADPLTADDIRAIDAHAAAHHVELVPSLSTFGHFYTALVSPRKHLLNELPIDASQLPFSWWDRMGHYTLDCRNPASLALVREMILELRPLFRSRLFNICCDETFDLGKGRNATEAARVGNGRLYLDFLKQLMAIVREAGATPMFWGDIVGNHPELVRELPRDAIALDWDYSPNLKDTKSRLFKRARVPFHVCPGVTGWDRWVNDLDTATANILAFAKRGKRDGATGLLNTDWGDRGHINALGNSMHGALLGAAAAWNVSGTRADAFDAAFGRLELGDAEAGARAVALMREAGNLNVVSWRQFTLWLDPTPHRPATWWDERTGVPADMLAIEPRRAFAAAKRLEKIAAQFAKLVREEDAADPLARREFLLGCRGSALLNALGGHIVCLVRAKKPTAGAPALLELTNDIRRFEAEFSRAWHARNRPSEYRRLRDALLEIARRAEIAALRGVWIKTPRPAAPGAAR